MTKTYKVGRGGTLPRISASLAGASAKATVTLTIQQAARPLVAPPRAAKVVLAK